MWGTDLTGAQASSKLPTWTHLSEYVTLKVKRAPRLGCVQLRVGGFLYSESLHNVAVQQAEPPLHRVGDGCTPRGNRTDSEVAQAKPRTVWAYRRWLASRARGDCGVPAKQYNDRLTIVGNGCRAESTVGGGKGT